MSDLIDRRAAIDALKNDMASLDHIIKGMSANDVRLDAYVSQRNQVNYDIYTINNLPPVQPEQLGTNLAEVDTDTISRAKAIDLIESIETERLKGNIELIYAPAIKGLRALPPAQPKRGKWEMGKDERFVKCSECGLMTTRNELRGLAVFGKNEPNFCPNCGADMRGEQDG